MATSEKQLQYSRDWAKKNPEKTRAIKSRYRQKHKARISAERKAERASNRAKLDAAKRKWEQENPDIVSAQRARGRIRKMNAQLNRELRFHYAITRDNFEAAMTAQGGVCMICGEHVTTSRVKRLVVDHCHISGALRGLLCHRCNCGLGYFKDDIERVKLAARYLELFAQAGDDGWVQRISSVQSRLGGERHECGSDSPRDGVSANVR